MAIHLGNHLSFFASQFFLLGQTSLRAAERVCTKRVVVDMTSNEPYRHLSPGTPCRTETQERDWGIYLPLDDSAS